MKLKWNEDKASNYRGNFTPMLFKFDNSPHIFGFDAYMSYKTFKPLVRKMAQQFGAKEVTVFEDNGTATMTVNAWLTEEGETFRFKRELPVAEGERRQFKFFSKSEVFPGSLPA